MDSSYVTALAALAGSMIGGLATLAASWLGKRVEFSAGQLAHRLNRREELYKDFIEEASKWVTHAHEHDDPQVSDRVGIYALVSQMRVVSSTRVVDSADEVVRAIFQTYRAPNRGFADVEELLDNQALNPLRDFSSACRDELLGLGRAGPVRT